MMNAVAIHSGTSTTVNVVVSTFYGVNISALTLRANNATQVGAYWLAIGKS